jgi:hypothetical protein
MQNQVNVSREVGRPSVAAAAFPGGWTGWKAGPQAGMPAPRRADNGLLHKSQKLNQVTLG